MIAIDHVGIDARDALSSARALSEILGAAEPVSDGADDDMWRVDLAHGASLLFANAQHVSFEHIAFRVDPLRFSAIVQRLHARGSKFGNDPEQPDNGQTEDPLGGGGRVYFRDENGHLFEVVC